MGGYSIRLAGPSACQELPLHPAVHGDITRELLEARQGCPPKFRAEDRYTPELLRQDGSPLGRFSLLVNGQPLADTENVPLFRDAGAGLVRLGAVVEGELWESQWLAVVGKKASPGPELAQMIEQVYAKSSPLYQGLESELEPGGESSLLSRVQLAWRILEAYRKNFPRFRDRGVYTVTPQAQLRSFQRLPAVSRDTLRYIACHPEELEPAPGPGGIRAKGRSWQPRRALAPVPKSSGDTEENRAVLNFLYTVAQSLERLRRELEALDQSLTAPGRGEETCSHQALEAIFHRLFQHSLGRLPALDAGLWEQLRKYQDLLSLGPELLSRPSRPGAACLSLPHYREIFSLEEKWLRLPPADIREEKHLCAMLTSWVVYERYVLVWLLEQLSRLGSLLQAQRLAYREEGLYTNTECNNLFVFGLPKGKTAALYYQPKIGKTPEPGGLGLYRTGDGGSFWMPDYVLKICHPEGPPCFLVLDAKYSSPWDVLAYQGPELAEKYLLSLSPAEEGARLAGLCILAGKSSGDRPSRFRLEGWDSTGTQLVQAQILTLRPGEEAVDLPEQVLGQFLDRD